MARVPIEIGISSMIESMAYDEETQELFVQFPGRNNVKPPCYTYRNVSTEIRDKLVAELDVPGGSVGKLFISLVKNQALKLEDHVFTL
jgi:hypothetical protein